MGTTIPGWCIYGHYSRIRYGPFGTVKKLKFRRDVVRIGICAPLQNKVVGEFWIMKNITVLLIC